MVMDPSGLLSAAGPVGLHSLSLALQCGVALFLFVHGARRLLATKPRSAGFDKWGALPSEALAPRLSGALQLFSAALLLAPLLLGTSWLASLTGAALAVALFLGLGALSSGPGARIRALAFAAAAFTLLFMAWERDDPASLTLRIANKSLAWRDHEVEWQRHNDLNSPKEGDLAPDFELQDPSGEKSVRLSSFRGKRPVALTFGSYT